MSISLYSYKMILADTSMWIPFFNGEESPEMDRFQKMIIEDRVCMCPPVLQEILQGTSSDRNYRQILNTTDGLMRLEFDSYEAAIGAAGLYRELRKKGRTIRKSNDCLIAWYALQFNVRIWCRDRDFDQIARYFPLIIYQ